MISPSDLQAFLEKIEGQVGVDLVKIGQGFAPQQGNVNDMKSSYRLRRFRVALDIEGCLDRFYGGYFSDWACGGQFNRCFEFVQLLMQAFSTAEMEVIVFFDGTLKENKKLQQERNDCRQRIISVLKHIRMIGTPPPKIWWLPPSGLRTCLRNALRSLNIPVVQTINDHTMEVIDYYHEHKLNAIIGLSPDYIICNVKRYFSSHDLRLSYKGALETKELLVHHVLTNLNISPEQLAILAAFLGGYILLNEVTLKRIYHKLNIEYNLDFEARIRQLADLVRPIPPNSPIENVIKLLNLEDYADVMKESIEYYQRKGGKRYLGSKKKPITEIIKSFDVIQDIGTVVPMASETSDTDEIANKILNDVNNLVNDSEQQVATPPPGTEIVRKCVKFVYSLPAEVLRTSYQRHQRGSMDPRIYILLTKKEILLPQVLEDEQYREMPPVHVFYRPARQMIYAILFNLYHQKYMCSKTKDNLPTPEVIINEWIWSPQNEYKKPEEVCAIQLPWAVPTIQRLWFGTAIDDKHRRMRAFLTVMRSDSQLMLNRNYVPQHMIVLACVLRYIVTSGSIINRQELDAFLVTAFSPYLINVDYTQEMVLPGVYLRGVFLATLLMQGVETAQLANDACGVPLPWSMTNPWLFFDGKLFHLKLKMSVCLQNIREMCDDQLEIVMKIERFRKAILEDIEDLLPMQMDTIYRQNIYPQNSAFAGCYGGKQQQYQMVNNGYPNYGQGATLPPQQLYYNPNISGYNRNITNKNGVISSQHPGSQAHIQKNHRSNYSKSGYQLKVGGVVVGSWANGSNRPVQGTRISRSGMIRYPINRGRPLNNRYRMGVNIFGSNVSGYVQKGNRFNQKARKNKTKKENGMKSTIKNASINKDSEEISSSKTFKTEDEGKLELNGADAKIDLNVIDDKKEITETTKIDISETDGEINTDIIVKNGTEDMINCDDENNVKKVMTVERTEESNGADGESNSDMDSMVVACETNNAVNSNSTQNNISNKQNVGKNNKKNKKKNLLNNSNNAKVNIQDEVIECVEETITSVEQVLGDLKLGN